MELPPSPSAAQIALYLIAASIAGGIVTLLINKISNWTSGRSRAEVVEIHARSVKLGTEAQAISAQEIREATSRIVELVDINSQLQEELSEAARRRDNLDFDLKRERFEHGQLLIRHELQAKFIEQLNAANKLGVQLKDLTPKMELINETVQRVVGAKGDDHVEDDQVAGDGTGG
jgi:hypothetical protein